MTLMQEWMKLQRSAEQEKDVIPITLNLHTGVSLVGKIANPIKQSDHDSRVLEITLVKGMDSQVSLSQDSVINLFVRKGDGEIVMLPSHSVNDTLGKVTFKLSAQALAVAGIIKCEVAIIGLDGSLLSFPIFELPVTESIHTSDKIVSSTELNVLSDAISRVENWQGQIDEALVQTKAQYEQEYNEQAVGFDISFDNQQKARAEEFATWKNTSIALDPIVALQNQINNMPFFEIVEDGE